MKRVLMVFLLMAFAMFAGVHQTWAKPDCVPSRHGTMNCVPAAKAAPAKKAVPTKKATPAKKCAPAKKAEKVPCVGLSGQAWNDCAAKQLHAVRGDTKVIRRRVGNPKRKGDTLFSVGYSTRDKVSRNGKKLDQLLAKKPQKPARVSDVVTGTGTAKPAKAKDVVTGTAKADAKTTAAANVSTTVKTPDGTTVTTTAGANSTASASAAGTVYAQAVKDYGTNPGAICGYIDKLLAEPQSDPQAKLWIQGLATFCKDRAQTAALAVETGKESWFDTAKTTAGDIWFDGPLCHLALKKQLHGVKCRFNPVLATLDYLTWRMTVRALPRKWQDNVFGRNRIPPPPPPPASIASGGNGANQPIGYGTNIAGGNDTISSGTSTPGYDQPVTQPGTGNGAGQTAISAAGNWNTSAPPKSAYDPGAVPTTIVAGANISAVETPMILNGNVPLPPPPPPPAGPDTAPAAN